MLTIQEKKEIVDSFIQSQMSILNKLQEKLNSYKDLDKSLLENRLSQDGLNYEINNFSNVINALIIYKNNISN